jgi:predicted DNA-binding protein YlxM (UPF0122 family)
MDKTEETILFGMYETLLPEKLKIYLNLFLVDDLSVTEISETQKVSKQAVSEQINKAKKELIKYENSLHLVEKSKERLSLLYKIKEDNNMQLIEKLIELEEK